MAWPKYLIERAIRSPGLDLGVVPGSTPVVSFGDPSRATVATLGINPSHQEFLDSAGRLLDGSKRRIATLRSLGVERYEELTAEHGAAIVDDCAGYFERRPYRWFNPLDDKELDGPGPVRVERTSVSRVDVAEALSPRSETSSVAVEQPTPRVRVRPNVTVSSSPPTAAMSGSAAIVHFPHPGGEHVPRGDTMPWNTGNHRRKFLTSPGTHIDAEGQQWRDEIVFWGEWEAQSRVVRRWSKNPGLPTVLHAPYWSPPGYEGERQNTDPWVFGDAFLYSNCRQFTRAHGTATAMQGLPAGSMILFGSTRGTDFVLDTVFVVGQIVGRYQPISAGDDLRLDAAFDFCTIQSLADYAPDLASATLTLYRGATIDNPVEGMYSFVPCRRRDDPDLRFPRPAVDLLGIINPRSKQSPAGAKILRPISEVVQAWHDAAVQVEAADLLLGVQIDTPERKPAQNP